MTEQATIVPRLAFVINLAHSAKTHGSQKAHGLQSVGLGARREHLIHLFRGYRLPATWAVADAAQARLLRDAAAHRIALTLDGSLTSPAQSAARFGRELSHRLAGLADACGTPDLVVGDHGLLASRMATLSELGIRAIFTSSAPAAAPLKPRRLPCGMWLLAPRVQLPKRRFSRWLPMRATSLKELLASACDGNILASVAADECEQAGVRAMQNLETLLRDVSWSATSGQLQVATISEVVADLTERNAVKPQRSILRVAA